MSCLEIPLDIMVASEAKLPADPFKVGLAEFKANQLRAIINEADPDIDLVSQKKASRVIL